jgi:hypothetical protein
MVAISSAEQTEINGVRHGLISVVVGVHVVAAIVFWKQPCRSVRIPQRAIKVDHCIEGARRTDPLIYLAPFHLVFGVVQGEWRSGDERASKGVSVAP